MFGHQSAADVNAEVAAMAAERDALMQRRGDPVVEYWRQSHADYDSDAARFQAERAVEDQRRTEEHEKRQRELRDSEAARQRAIGEQFTALCEDIVTLRSRIAAAQATIAEGDPATAALAAGELVIAEAKLGPAETALLNHQAANNPGLHLHGMTDAQVVDFHLREYTRQR